MHWNLLHNKQIINKNIHGEIIKCYGKFQTVLLSKSDYDSLVLKVDDVSYWINQMDKYIHRTGKEYRNHRMAILNWYLKENKLINAETKDKDNFFKNMNYKEFLNTKYWKKVSLIVREKAKHKCQLCGEEETQLNVHHNTYKHHGDELNHLEDLVCLCNKCHKKYHNIKEVI